MMKALFRKQMMEVFSWVYRDKKKNRSRSKAGIIGYAILYLVLFGIIGCVFYFVADASCATFVEAGFGWLYFAIMGLLALFMGVFGSVFNTYASLYQAKDNDLLLAMPVQPAKILLVRLLGVYALGLMYALLVMIPTLIVWFVQVRVSIAAIVCTLLLSVVVLVLSAILGWVVAVIAGHVKNKNIVTVILSLAFIAAYYFFYAKANVILQSILAQPQAAAEKVRSFLFPLYHFGKAAQGNLLSLLIFAACALVPLAIVWLVLSKSFLHLATADQGAARAKSKMQKGYAYAASKSTARADTDLAKRISPAPQHSVSYALFQKERHRFTGSAAYMLNCGLGIILMPVCAVALLWKQDMIREMIETMFAGYEEIVWLFAAAAIGMTGTMNDIAAPSVSLEGKSIWIVQSLPVSGRQVLMAKVKLQLILTAIPAALLTAAAEWVLKPTPAFAVMIAAAVAAFILFMAVLGLALNLKMPNLDWTNETVPIKQSAPVMIALFGGWALVAVLAVGCWLLNGVFSPLAYLCIATALLLAGFAALLRWIQTRGARLFERL